MWKVFLWTLGHLFFRFFARQFCMPWPKWSHGVRTVYVVLPSTPPIANTFGHDILDIVNVSGKSCFRRKTQTLPYHFPFSWSEHGECASFALRAVSIYLSFSLSSFARNCFIRPSVFLETLLDIAICLANTLPFWQCPALLPLLFRSIAVPPVILCI